MIEIFSHLLFPVSGQLCRALLILGGGILVMSGCNPPLVSNATDKTTKDNAISCDKHLEFNDNRAPTISSSGNIRISSDTILCSAEGNNLMVDSKLLFDRLNQPFDLDGSDRIRIFTDKRCSNANAVTVVSKYYETSPLGGYSVDVQFLQNDSFWKARICRTTPISTIASHLPSDRTTPQDIKNKSIKIDLDHLVELFTKSLSE